MPLQTVGTYGARTDRPELKPKRKFKFGTRTLHVYGEATSQRVEPVRTVVDSFTPRPLRDVSIIIKKPTTKPVREDRLSWVSCCGSSFMISKRGLHSASSIGGTQYRAATHPEDITAARGWRISRTCQLSEIAEGTPVPALRGEETQRGLLSACFARCTIS